MHGWEPGSRDEALGMLQTATKLFETWEPCYVQVLEYIKTSFPIYGELQYNVTELKVKIRQSWTFYDNMFK